MGRSTRQIWPLVGLGLAIACGGGASRSTLAPDAGAEVPPDVEPPTVVATSPKNGAQGVLLDAAITATFSEAMSPDSVLGGSFALSPGVQGALSSNGTTVKFTPGSPLEPGTKYTATLKASARDVAGNPLEAPFSWTFTTLQPPPAPVAITDAERDVTAAEPATLDATHSLNPSGRPLAFTWTQLSGEDVTSGKQILSGARPQFMAPASVGTLEFALVANDGIRDSGAVHVQVNVLEDRSKAVFVSASGDDGHAGTRPQPMKTIQAAIDKAQASGADVYVAAGEYGESPKLASGVSLYGGFRAGDWVRDGTAITKISSPTAKGVTGDAVGDLAIDGFSIVCSDASVPGESSYGILLSSSAGVRISNNAITAGNGADGADGLAGADGSTGASGEHGGKGCVDSRTCPGARGGTGGAGPGAAGGAGGGGGGSGAGGTGADGAGSAPGAGGAGASSGNPGRRGDDGGPGADGIAGANGNPGGAGGAGPFGHVPRSGLAGADGADGSGGGGGGGGGGQSCSWCFLGTGNGAGGGGAGGAGGKGGAGGSGGGGSFGIFLFNPAGVTVAPTNTFHLGTGGAGGRGGAGGAGGQGGPGGAGATTGTSEIGAGGDGGSGGAGGAGGRGGRGSDGPAAQFFRG